MNFFFNLLYTTLNTAANRWVAEDRTSESMMMGKLIKNPLDTLPASHCEK